jgi:hypothetical protein
MPISLASDLQAIVEHREVARLEDVQGQPRAGQQERPGQRENRDNVPADRSNVP